MNTKVGLLVILYLSFHVFIKINMKGSCGLPHHFTCRLLVQFGGVLFVEVIITEPNSYNNYNTLS